jgi:hypothetical protein
VVVTLDAGRILNVVTVLAGWVEVAVLVNDLSCVVVMLTSLVDAGCMLMLVLTIVVGAVVVRSNVDISVVVID